MSNEQRLKARAYRLLNEANDARLIGLHGKAERLHDLALKAFDVYYEYQQQNSEN